MKVVKMLKKILILAASLNISYVLPSDSSYSPGEDLIFGGAALVSGIICAWLAFKDFKKVNAASKEVQRQFYILNEMGVTLYTQFQRDFILGFIPTSVLRERYARIHIPSNFSQQQAEKAKEHWSLLLANQKKDDDYFIAFTAALGSLILTPAGIAGIIQAIQNFK